MTKRIVMLLLFLIAMTTEAQTRCMSLHAARSSYPGSYLSWRGNHCWYAPGKRQHESRLSRRAREDTVSIPISEGSSPSTAAIIEAPKPPEVDMEVVKEKAKDVLRQVGFNRLAASNETKPREVLQAPWTIVPAPKPAEEPPKKNNKEVIMMAVASIEALVIILFVLFGSAFVKLIRWRNP